MDLVYTWANILRNGWSLNSHTAASKYTLLNSSQRTALNGGLCPASKKTRHARRDLSTSLETQQNGLPLFRNLPTRWRVSAWTPCTRPCSGGHRSRNVLCTKRIDFDLDVVVVSDTECPTPKPKAKAKCSDEKCVARWHAEPWTEVSYIQTTFGGKLILCFIALLLIINM